MPPCRLSLVLLVPAATAWAGCLVVIGLWLIFDPIAAGPVWSRPAVALAGVAAFAAGQFVFMAAVADRLFPNSGPGRTIWMLEMAIFGLACASAVASVLLL